MSDRISDPRFDEMLEKLKQAYKDDRNLIIIIEEGTHTDHLMINTDGWLGKILAALQKKHPEEAKIAQALLEMGESRAEEEEKLH